MRNLLLPESEAAAVQSRAGPAGLSEASSSDRHREPRGPLVIGEHARVVVDGRWLDPLRLGQRETEDLRVEAELRVHRPPDVLCLSEAVLLTFEGEVGHWYARGSERFDDHLGLVRWDDLVRS